MDDKTPKPTLYLTGPGLPTLDDLIALARKLTGREPTPEEIDQARKTLARPLSE